MEKVDYSYAFSAPHRLTLSQPSAPFKVLADICTQSMMLSWSYQSLLNSTYNVWQPPVVSWKLEASLWADGERLPYTAWRRDVGGVPAFIAECRGKGVWAELYGIAVEGGAAVRLKVRSEDARPHKVDWIIEHKNGWVISNPAWIDGKNPNLLTCMQNEKADRVLADVMGADEYPVVHRPSEAAAAAVPMSSMAGKDRFLAQKSVVAVFNVAPDAGRTGSLYIPYNSTVSEDLEALSAFDCEAAIEAAADCWRDYLKLHCRLILPDEGMSDAFLASLADLFVMREPLDDKTCAVVCGTEVYRSTNDGEPVLTDTVFDRMGYENEVARDMPVHLGGQGKDGNWNTPQGWCMTIWSAAGNKSAFAWNHYQLTGSKTFLKSVYPAMKASSAWQRRMRLSTQNDPDPTCRGLMPRGMGDCGMMNGDDYFGVFYAHNCGALIADRITLAAARELGREQDAAQLEGWVKEASEALAASIRANAVVENGVPHIPSGPKMFSNTSRYGSLNPCFSGVLAFDDPLIQGTLCWLEQDISEGGLPKDLGWLKNGLWVAIALDNLSKAYLEADLGDKAVRYLYPTVNHASPFNTWCEERGACKNSDQKTGDMEHLWTPVALCGYLLDALCLPTEKGLRLASGTPRPWLAVSNAIGIQELRVPGGRISYKLTRKTADTAELRVERTGKSACEPFEVELRLPEEKLCIRSVSAQGCTAEARGCRLIVKPDESRMSVHIKLG